MSGINGCLSKLFCCSNNSIVDDTKPKESGCKRTIHSITTFIALAAIAAVIAGALGFVGIIAMANPLAIGLMAGGTILFLISTVLAYKYGKNESKTLIGATNHDSGVSLPKSGSAENSIS